LSPNTNPAKFCWGGETEASNVTVEVGKSFVTNLSRNLLDAQFRGMEERKGVIEAYPINVFADSHPQMPFEKMR
jgi:hypothetical protein